MQSGLFELIHCLILLVLQKFIFGKSQVVRVILSGRVRVSSHPSCPFVPSKRTFIQTTLHFQRLIRLHPFVIILEMIFGWSASQLQWKGHSIEYIFRVQVHSSLCIYKWIQLSHLTHKIHGQIPAESRAFFCLLQKGLHLSIFQNPKERRKIRLNCFMKTT